MARRPLERERAYLDGGRRTTQLMRDSLGGMPRRLQGNHPVGLAEYLRSTRDHYASYHHHKEQMAYGAATLYVGALTAAALTPSRVWEPAISKTWFLVASHAVAAVAFVFVGWQLRKREFAADLVRGCGALLAEDLAGQTKGAELQPATHGEHQFPAALVSRLNAIARERGLFQGPRLSELITYVVMGLWTAIAVLRVWHAA